MSLRSFIPMGLVLALPCLLTGQEPQVAQPQDTLSRQAISRRVDGLLKGTGERVVLDQDLSEWSGLRSEKNKISYFTSTKDHRLVRIEIQPVGEETPNTTRLAALFLTVLSAVETPEEGARLANLLTIESRQDGRARAIALRNGMKLMKVHPENATPKFIIDFGA